MLNNQFIEQVIHPFILYSLFGTFFGYILVKAAIMFLGIKQPKGKIMLLFLPVFVPFLTLAIRQSVARQCFFRINAGRQSIDAVSQFICNSGTVLAYILIPLFLLALTIAIIKGGMSIIACRKLVSKYGLVTEKEYPELVTILAKLADKAEIERPGLIITSQKIARSFTFGYKKPVIVLTEGMLQYLDIEELEAVLAHETAHIVRGDSILNWLTFFTRDLMFFAPVVFFIFKDILEEIEKATDDITLQLTDKHFAFGEALIKVWRFSPKTIFSNLAFNNFSSHPNFISSNGALESRLDRIIFSDDANIRLNTKLVAFMAALIVSLILVILYYVC